MFKSSIAVTLLICSFFVSGQDAKQETKDVSIQTKQELSKTNDSNNQPSTIASGINLTKDITHILFFLSMATIGILSYRQARKTVFSPIKTEIFKYQLQSFQEVISHFQNKSEVSLIDDMDMKSVVDINCFELFYDYVQTFFDGEMEIDEAYIKEKRKMSKGGIMSAEFAAENLQVIGPDSQKNKNAKSYKVETNDPALKLAQWNDRKYGMIHFTAKYREAVDEIERYQNSPLLPSGLKLLLQDYSQLMHKALTAVGEAMEEAGKQMPVNYPNKDSLVGFGDSWLSNIYNRKRPKLEPKALEILDYINTYLGIDSLANENT